MKNVGQQLLSGGLSGFASTVCLQPFDLLKTRLQQEDGTLKLRKTTLVVKTMRDIIATQGVVGLWGGTAASLARNVPGVALYMTSLTQLRTFMATSPYFARVHKEPAMPAGKNTSVLPVLTSQGNLVAGATTRVAVGFVLNPFTLLKARYESGMYAYNSLSGALSGIIRLGPSELLKGFLASALRDGPYAGIFVLCYEGIKRETASLLPRHSSTQSAGIHGFSAAGAGAIATFATQPFDVIKTKIQVRSESHYRGFAKTIRTIWATRGMTGFFDGAYLRMSRKVGSSAIAWAVYESILIFMRTD